MKTLVKPGDVILVHVEDKAAFFGRVEEIVPDVKKGWRRIRFLVLTAPLQELSWILEPSQIDGEPFTMGGTRVRIERLPDPRPAEAVEPEASQTKSTSRPRGRGRRKAEVISFPARQKA